MDRTQHDADVEALAERMLVAAFGSLEEWPNDEWMRKITASAFEVAEFFVNQRRFRRAGDKTAA